MSDVAADDYGAVRSWSLPTGLDGVGVFLAVSAWVVLSGSLGLVLGIAFVGVAVALTPPFAFAIGQILLLGLLPDASILEAVIAELGLGIFLLSAFTSRSRQYRFWLEAAVAVTLTVGVGYVAVLSGVQLWIVVAAGIGVWTFLAYGLHRFELVQLNLVTDNP